MRCTRTMATAVLALLSVGAAGCSGDDEGAYPSKRIELVVPYPAGGATDSLARIWAKCFEGELGQTVTVVNREGGEGATATQFVAEAEPDGYTLEATSDSPVLVVPEQVDTPYTYEDLKFIAMLGYSPDVFLVPGDSEFETIEDLASALQSGEDLKVATYGPITSSAMRGELMAEANGFTWNTVPFNSGADHAQSVASGSSDLGYGDINIPMIELADAGEIRILGAAEDVSAYKEGIPTLEDAGLEGYAGDDANVVYLTGPKDMPEEVTTALEDAYEACREDDDLVKNSFQVQLLPDEGTVGTDLDAVVEDIAGAYREAVAQTK